MCEVSKQYFITHMALKYLLAILWSTICLKIIKITIYYLKIMVHVRTL